jgi:hypothetical protein
VRRPRLTAAGKLLALALPLAAALIVTGDPTLEIVGLTLVILLAAGIGVGGLPPLGGSVLGYSDPVERLRPLFDPRRRLSDRPLAAFEDEEEAWRRERARRSGLG